MKKAFFSIATLAGLALLSCSDKDNGTGLGSSSETVRLTVTVSGSYDTEKHHNISASFGGHDPAAKPIDVKVNGKVETNQALVHANAESFNSTKTQVFESVGNYHQITASVGGFNISDDFPFTVTYKLEKGSKTIANETQTVTDNSGVLSKNYTVKFDD